MKKNKKEDFVILRRIQAAGVPIDSYVEPVLPSSALRIEQLRDAMTNYVTDVRRGGAIYQAFVRLTCTAAGPIFLKDLLVSTDYDDTIQLASDPAESKSAKPYQLRNGASFERHLCLNHKLFATGALRRGDCIEGFLLADSLRQVPAHFPEHCQIKAVFTIVDQFANYHSAALLLALERTNPARPYPLANAKGVVPSDMTDFPPAAFPDGAPGRSTELTRNAGLFERHEVVDVKVGKAGHIDDDSPNDGTNNDKTFVH